MKMWLVSGATMLIICVLALTMQPSSQPAPAETLSEAATAAVTSANHQLNNLMLTSKLLQIRAEADSYSRKAGEVERFARATDSLADRGGKGVPAPTAGAARAAPPSLVERAAANPKRSGKSTCTTKGPDRAKTEPLFQCASYTPSSAVGGSHLEASVASALDGICSMRKVSDRPSFDLSLDCRYAANYNAVYESEGIEGGGTGTRGGGWVNQAVVTTLNKKRYHKGVTFMDAIHYQVESVHKWSKTAAILLFAVEGEVSYDDLGGKIPADEWPRTVVFWLRGQQDPPLQSSFVQLRTMILSFALAAVHFEVGMLAGPLLDTLLERAAVQTNAEYPYPIYPQFNLGHSNPTFTYHALPFLSSAYVRASTDGNRGNGHNLGSDWISSPGIAANLTRQWCKWDIGALPASEMLRNNYKLLRAPTFVNRAYGRPTVFGYAVFSPEGNVDRITIHKMWPIWERSTPAAAAKHWLYHANDWHALDYTAAGKLGLDCLI